MKVKIELGFTQYAHATVYIDAASLEEAQELAEDIDPGEVADWNYSDGTVFVNDVVEAGPTDEQMPVLLAQRVSGIADDADGSQSSDSPRLQNQEREKSGETGTCLKCGRNDLGSTTARRVLTPTGTLCWECYIDSKTNPEEHDGLLAAEP